MVVVSGHVLARALTDPSIQRGLAVPGSDLVFEHAVVFLYVPCCLQSWLLCRDKALAAGWE